MGKSSQAMSAALLVMDIQEGTVTRLGERSAILIESLRTAIAAARQASLPVIFVVVGFRKGFPEVSPDNKFFSAVRSGTFPGLEEPVAVHQSVAPKPGDFVVTKRRVSAFAGSDLEVLLRGLGVRHLVLTGISTSGVVLSTLREAADKDFRLTVLSDGCADMDAEVHQVLLSKVFPRQAEVLNVKDWTAALKG
jgi:nicotinamidase-related amidase